MPLLLLVRHGETAWNRARRWQGQHDLPLTALGEAQAVATARRLMVERPVALYSSDLIRARRTAEAIAEACGLEVQLDPGLREVDVGLVGRPDLGRGGGALSRRARALGRRRHGLGRRRDLPGDGRAGRRRGHRDREPPRSRRDRVVVVAHGGPIRALAAHAVALEGDGRRRLAAGPNASLTTIDVRDDGWRLVGYNDAGHIATISEPAPIPAGEPA